ncbi:MAG: hypothetical protein KJZ65_12385 [Phycisphaerales bacterium]|nr:hypothetical protein [Phycisphaerales bacterium]
MRHVTDLTNQAVVRAICVPEIIDTRNFAEQIVQRPMTGPARRVKEMLPEHTGIRQRFEGPDNGLPVGGHSLEPRVQPGLAFPGISQTGWVPPDPTLAVGPNHIVTTVNQDIAFFTKQGTLLFQVALGSPGNPGFFEPVGAGNFTFDPKVFYDHIAQRFVVVAPEVYGSTQAWISIAVSDDSNPIGTWYKYRTDAVIQVGTTTFWWDYPGFGFDNNAYYVNSNLFGLNQSGWGGVGFRVFRKSDMLAGQPVTYWTLRDGNAASAQAAQHFGSNIAPFFVSVNSGTSLRVHAITNPITNPALVSTTVTVPGFSSPTSAPSVGASAVELIDNRIFNAHWRDGNLYAAHGISAGGENAARWYHLRTNNWPSSGSVTLVQSGNVDGGPGLHTFFPAIYSNSLGEVAMVVGSSSSTQRIAVNATGRVPSDPAGTMAPLTQLKLSDVNGGGRWGDYYDICVDPLDDRTFWVIGEYVYSGGWNNWISSFTVSTIVGPLALPDSVSFLIGGQGALIDVLANDSHTTNLPIHIASFDAVSTQGGSVVLSSGTGPGGRDQLLYTAPLGFTGTDTFEYVVADNLNNTAEGAVAVAVWDPADVLSPAIPPLPGAGLNVSYYVVDSPAFLPDFDSMTPYATAVVNQINYPSTNNNFATSGRADNVGAVFKGYVSIPQAGPYRFFTTSDDGSALSIGDRLVVDNDGQHGMTEQWGTVALYPGLHPIRVDFFEAGGGAGLIVEYEGPGIDRQVIPVSVFRRDTPCPPDLVPPLGAIDFFDVQVFLGMFSAQDPAADLNYDGRFDFFDIQIYLQLVAAGC